MSLIVFKNLLDTPYMQQLRIWRNLDFVRDNMTNKALISHEEHQKYLTMLHNNPDTRKVFVAMQDTIPFGVVNFSIYQESGYIEPGMYLVDSRFLGKGYGMVLQYVRLEYIFTIMPAGRMRTIVLRTIYTGCRSIWAEPTGLCDCY